MNVSRRIFLKGAANAGLVTSLGGIVSALHFRPVFAEEAKITPDMVRFTPDIEAIVRLMEETPRDTCVETFAKKVRDGLPYQQFLAALFLAGIRNVNPQPPGFKFHCVFVIHSANYLSQMAPPEERFLPLFWALDEFKKSQQDDVRQGDFVLREVQGDLPSGDAAWAEFRTAMDAWDEQRADRAITALVRGKGPAEVFEGLWEFGARDYRNIGHKAIFVSNAYRTLETIGWQHAEPVLRSLVLGLLDFGRSEVVNKYAYEDQAYLKNTELAGATITRLPGDWTDGAGGDGAAALDIVAALREGRTVDACQLAARSLVEGRCKAGAVWDAVHLTAGELMMRQPGIAGVHTVTSSNALHFAFRTTSDPKTRLLMLLQGVGWLGQFRNFIDAAKDKDVRLTELAPTEIAASPEKAAEEILVAVSNDKLEAARKALRYGQQNADPNVFFNGARHLVFVKSVDVHEYKWAAGIFEDYHHVSRQWRPHMLAASTYYLKGAGHADSAVFKRAMATLKPA